MADRGLIVDGLAPLLRDLSKVSKAIAAELRNELRQVAAPVALDAKFRESDIQKRGVSTAAALERAKKQAAGIKVIVRQRGVSVEQTLGRTTGRRPDFAGLQMREALLPALDDNIGAIERRTEEFLDGLLDGIGGRL
jgi:uncharacterized protein with von Willebrand factor type A (vWA) domain